MSKLKDFALKVKGGLLAIAAVLTSGLALTLSNNSVAHAQAVTMDPTQQANINSAVGSIPNTAISEVFAIFPVVMPYILVITVVGFAIFLVFWLMRKGHGGH